MLFLQGKVLKVLEVAGLPFLNPFVRLAAGEPPQEPLREIGKFTLVPLLALGLFLALWTGAARRIETKHGTVPTPAEVWAESHILWQSHREVQRQKIQFLDSQRQRAGSLVWQAQQLDAQAAAAPDPARRAAAEQSAQRLRDRARAALAMVPSAAPTFPEQIFRSLQTVFAGFLMATVVAIPVGIVCGMSPTVNAALNPIIQLLKPVSPLAWLPLVMIVVGALYTVEPGEGLFERSFINSAVTVALCSIWPTLANTAWGVATVDKNYLNVARVLRLSWWQQLTQIILPASLPLIFAGLRISLSVGWMVLVAADMLAQNPGLGKFIWDMFQNGSSQSMSQILVAVLAIGVIGLLLDRLMICLRNLVSYGELQAA